MKKKLSTIIGAFVTCTLLVLSGCGDSSSNTETNGSERTSDNSGITNTTEAVTMSQAFNTESVWFLSETPNEDEVIWAIYFFDGKGKITSYPLHYRGNELTYSDLQGLSNEEIRSFVQEYLKKLLKIHAENVIAEIQEEYDDYECGYIYGGTCSEVIDMFENVEYREPEPQPFEIHDDDFYDKLVTYDEYIINVYEATDPPYYSDDCECDFMKKNAPINSISVGNTYYNGYIFSDCSRGDDGNGWYTRVSEDHPGFILD